MQFCLKCTIYAQQIIQSDAVTFILSTEKLNENPNLGCYLDEKMQIQRNHSLLLLSQNIS